MRRKIIIRRKDGVRQGYYVGRRTAKRKRLIVQAIQKQSPRSIYKTAALKTPSITMYGVPIMEEDVVIRIRPDDTIKKLPSGIRTKDEPNEYRKSSFFMTSPRQDELRLWTPDQDKKYFDLDETMKTVRPTDIPLRKIRQLREEAGQDIYGRTAKDKR